MYGICIYEPLHESGAIWNLTASIGTGATGRNVRSTAFPSAKSKSCSEASRWLGLMPGTRRPRNAFALLEGQPISVASLSPSLFVAFTWRLRGKQRLIRPVSARHMHQKEVAAYEKKVSRSENG
jgi:hypothetical protein